MSTTPTIAPATWTHKFAFAVVSSASGVLLFPIVLLAAPILGQEAWGRFSWALGMAVILESVIDFGLKEITTRAVAREPRDAKRYLANTFGLKLVLGGAGLALFVGAAVLFRSDGEARWAVAVLGASAMLRSYMTTMRSVFYAIDRFDLEAAIMVGDRLLVLAFGAAALLLGYGVVGLAFAFVAGRVVALAGSAILVTRTVGPVSPAFDLPFWKDLQTQALPIGAFVVILQIYFSVDIVMLGLLSTDAETGVYAAAYRAYEAFGHVPGILAVVLTPHLSRLFMTAPAAHRSMARRSLLGAAVLSVPVTVGAWLAAPVLISLVYQGAYPESTRVFQILATGFVVTFPLGVLQAVAVSINAERTLLRTAVIGCVMKVLVTAALIPLFGGEGAAIGTVFGEALSLIVLAGVLRSHVARRLPPAH